MESLPDYRAHYSICRYSSDRFKFFAVVIKPIAMLKFLLEQGAFILGVILLWVCTEGIQIEQRTGVFIGAAILCYLNYRMGKKDLTK